MSDAKQRAQQRLADMVDDAATALHSSIKGTLHFARGSTRTADAKFVLSAVLEMQMRDEPAERAVSKAAIDDLAKRREELRLARQAERKQQT